MTPVTVQAVCYARFSPRPIRKKLKRQAGGICEVAKDCESVETQLERLRAYCACKGWEILAEFKDKDKSGAWIAGRPGFQKSFELAKRKKATLAVYNLSRLARNTREAIAIVEELSAANANLVSLHETIDTTTPMGRFFFGVMAGMAQLQREQISDGTSDAMRRHQATGRRMSPITSHAFGREDAVSCLPFGWALDPNDGDRMVEDHWEQGQIQEIKERARKGETLRAIARAMDEECLCRGHAWHHVTVGRILAR